MPTPQHPSLRPSSLAPIPHNTHPQPPSLPLQPHTAPCIPRPHHGHGPYTNEAQNLQFTLEPQGPAPQAPWGFHQSCNHPTAGKLHPHVSAPHPHGPQNHPDTTLGAMRSKTSISPKVMDLVQTILERQATEVEEPGWREQVYPQQVHRRERWTIREWSLHSVCAAPHNSQQPRAATEIRTSITQNTPSSPLPQPHRGLSNPML